MLVEEASAAGPESFSQKFVGHVILKEPARYSSSENFVDNENNMYLEVETNIFYLEK